MCIECGGEGRLTIPNLNPELLNPSDLPWPFRGLFLQLLYIYNLYLKFEPIWFGIGRKIIENRTIPG